MLVDVLLAAEPGGEGSIINLNGLVSGGVSTAVILAVVYIIRLIADRTIPSRSDSRASQALVLEGLNNLVKVLQEEKKADGDLLRKKQDRIEALEDSANADYDRIRELRNEILDLTERLAQKDRHINTLVIELRKLGAQVTGIDLDAIEVTHTAEEVRRIRTGAVDTEAPQQR